MGNQNHPKLGSKIRVEPIRKKRAINDIKTLLADHPRNYCFFVLGINTALRANELLSIQAGQVRHLSVGDSLPVWQSKTEKYRRVTLNANAIMAISGLLGSRVFEDEDYLFWSRQGAVLTVPVVSRMVKGWCERVGLQENYGSHTLRKTWGYWQHKNNAPLPLLMVAFGHSTQEQTLAYLGIQPPDIEQIYELAL